MAQISLVYTAHKRLELMKIFNSHPESTKQYQNIIISNLLKGKRWNSMSMNRQKFVAMERIIQCYMPHPKTSITVSQSFIIKMELVITRHLEIIQLDNLVNLSLEKVTTNTTSACCCYNIDDDKVIRHKYDGLSILYKLFILVSSMSLFLAQIICLKHISFTKDQKSIKSTVFCVIKNEK